MAGRWVCVVCFLGILAPKIWTDDSSGLRNKRQTASQQPRIVTQDGHLIFQTGTNHNISFQSSGGFINVDGENFKAIAQQVKNNKATIDHINSGGNLGDVENRLTTVEASLSNLEPSGEVKTRLDGLTNDLSAVRDRVSALETAPTSPTGPSHTDVQALQQQVTTIRGDVDNLQNLLTQNECSSSPCRNGGTCVDLYNSYFCQCSSNWQGRNCDDDVNECNVYQGTNKGCQNGGTCHNTYGSFTCQCLPDWDGQRCTVRIDDCSAASHRTLCAHGTCVNVARVFSGQPKYECRCDEGWEAFPGNAACNHDIDECAAPRSPCSLDPPVQCINTPGDFNCGPCPAGYSGNGFQCTDIDECATNNGGCSRAPQVQCTNTVGSYSCAPCPAGYVGNGITCSYIGICNQNNGGCHPRARCRPSSVIRLRTCRCPRGWLKIGDGSGQGGCVRLPPGQCQSNPCQNGVCVESSGSYHCICNNGYTGTNCETSIRYCSSNPCQNGGTCTDGASGYQCQCTEGYTGDLCETAQQDCGGRLRGTAGVVSYPQQQGQSYAHNRNCAWVISVASDKIIEVTFTGFHLESHTRCRYDFLQIHDGPTAGSHHIGRFCGNELPNGNGIINSTHNHLYLWFHSDASISHSGFTLVWKAENPVCGGNLRDSDHGSINSPGYPGNYPVNRTCVWTVQVSPGNMINFQFGHLSMEHHDNCSYDYLLVKDGLLDSDPVLNRYCTSGNPAPIQTTGPYARLVFHSDRSITDTGFHITYGTIPSTPGCGGAFTSDSGILISPNYPNPYPHNGQCVWTITVPSTEVITLNFTNMDLEHHPSCTWDYVEVRDGGDEEAPMVGRYCGTSLPSVFTSTGNVLWIKFRSDSSARGSGFRTTWNVTCGGTYDEPTGTLRSPYHPNAYPHNKECIYLISQPEGSTISLEFSSFDLEGASNTHCEYDYLEVHDGSSSNAPMIGSRLCGPAIPGSITTTTNFLWMKFVSDGSVQNLGFQASYTVAEGTGCGGTLTSSSGMLSSPGHPNIYPHGVTCMWNIIVPAGNVVRLTFTSFHLESHQNCNFDYVEVYDNGTSSDNALLGKYCGSNVVSVLTSTDNIMSVVFVSDSSIAREGFSASYIALDASTVCGRTLTSSTGVIESPGFEDNSYPHNRNCEWVIHVPQGQQVILNITTFHMESHSNCDYDYLEIRNGGSNTSPLVGKYCGTEIDNPIESHSNQLYLHMVTDSSITGRGFQIYYDGTMSGCGGQMTAPTGSFVSPHYPNAYGHNAECIWIVQTSRGSRIDLDFVDLDLEHHGTCRYDYIQVKDGGPQGNQLAMVCGETIPQTIESSTNKLWVKFRTDYSANGRGFHAHYSANCNVRLTNRMGVIESPNFPEPYPHNRDCTWIVETSLGNTINGSFSHFALESHHSCRYDFLELRDGQTADADLIGKYCGQTTLPPFFTTSGRYLYVNFKSDYSAAYNGFRLEYITNGCGADFTRPTGTFHSPNYPDPYPHRRVCEWKITVATGSAIKLTITDFDVEAHTTCDFDVLDIFSGPDANSLNITHLCDTLPGEYTVQSSGNVMFVRFKSDHSVSGRGFTARYETVPGGCGGNFTVPSGTIASPNYPEPYTHNTQCRWNLNAAPLHTVKLTFVDFDVEDGGSCYYDYVGVYDGVSNSAPQLWRGCGRSVPEPNTTQSTGNHMFVHMSTDYSVSGRGFKADFDTACGGRINPTVDGNITSPNYPSNYRRNTNCTWVIESPDPAERVTLTFTHIDLEDDADCGEDYVKVLNGNDLDAPEVGTYCGQRIPAAITSYGSALTLVFVTNGGDQRTGFRAIYTQSLSSCGGDLTAEHGAFNSPAYPDSYPDGVECVWTITTSPGSRVILGFSLFELEQSSNCNHDFLEIREGSAGGRRLGRWCGTNTPSNLTAAHNLFVKFRSSESVPGVGFMAEYSTVYGGDIYATSGNLSSPGYPGSYPNDVNVVWTLNVPQDMIIRVEFSFIDVEVSSGACTYDYLQLQDGGDSDSPELAMLCGTETPEVIHSTSNQLRLVFYTDYSITGQGFLLQWQAVPQGVIIPTIGPTATTVPGCGSELAATRTEQNFTSPGYPSNYENNLNCVWVIRSEQGSRVAVKLTQMQLEGSSCYYDYVRLFNGETIYSSRLGSYCGRQTTDNYVEATSNVMTVQFFTDSSVNYDGFVANYKVACGGQIRADVGVIQSDEYPNPYPDNSNCSWTIRVARGRTIQVEFEAFNLQGSGTGSQCTGDYIEFFNGVYEDSPVLGSGRYCGTSTPSIPETSGEQMKINFISDSSGSSSGFKLTFREVSVSCGGHLVLTDEVSSGMFQSPNHPDVYPHNVDCVWIFTAPASERIQIDFHDFSVETHPNCNFDYLELRDGGTEHSAEINRFCGNNIPSTQRSTGNVMYVRLRSDNSVPHKGFQAEYKIATCGGRLHGNEGFITSPNYPNNYESGADCEWYIVGPTGHYLTFTFEEFRLDSSYGHNCTEVDYLEIREFNSTGTLLRQACGRSFQSPVDTPDSFAYIRFRSNAQSNNKGFKINFQASVEECGGDLTLPTGTFTSPNFPGSYAHSRQCEWRITVPHGRRVTLTFNDFDVEEPSHRGYCHYDYVEAYNGLLNEGWTLRSPRIARVCGTSIPDPIESDGNTMRVRFKTDGSISDRGFSATYTSDNEARKVTPYHTVIKEFTLILSTLYSVRVLLEDEVKIRAVACGGIIRGSDGSGIFASPGFDNGTYVNNTQCIWKLHNENAPNATTSLSFSTLSLESGGNNCPWDFVEVREGHDETGHLVGRYCGNDTLPRISAPGQSLWVVFISDSVIVDHGFKLTYKFESCGGILTDNHGFFSSPNYPSNYNHGDDCAWKIVAPEGYRIRIRAVQFSLESHSDCNYDDLEIFNGGLPTSPSIGRYCGTDGPPEFLSQSNQLRFEFHSDNSASAMGFKMEYSFDREGCGGLLHAQQGTISSPNWPDGRYGNNVECDWEVVVLNGYHIVLEWNAPFELEETDLCTSDFVEIYDVNPTDGTEISKKYCSSHIPETYRSVTNRVTIRFRSNANNGYNGFSINFSAGCGAIYTAEEGTIYSPGWPLQYANNLQCNYTIRVDPQRFIVLEFQQGSFGIEGVRNDKYTDNRMVPIQREFDYWAVSDTSWYYWYPNQPFPGTDGAWCPWDWVEVFEGNITDGRGKGRRCGRNAPQPFSAQGTLSLQFITDYIITDRGFVAHYTTSECGGQFTDPTGQIKTPTHPIDYHHYADCIWNITVAENRIVELKFNFFDVEAHSRCAWDWVAIYDGPDMNSTLIGKYCGRTVSALPDVIRTRGNNMLINFRSDGSVSAGGFTATYRTTLGELQGCGGLLNESSGVITSPSVSSPGYYDRNLDCRWQVLIEPNKVVQLSINEFDVEEDSTCGYDYLQINDGLFTSDPLMGKYCARQLTEGQVITSSSNALNLRFYTDGSVQKPGFNISYDTADAVCGGTLQAGNNSATLTSPSYPNNYPSNLRCRWTLDAPVGDNIYLKINSIDMEQSTDCENDYLELRDAPLGENGHSVHYCEARGLEHAFFSAGRSAQVNFVTNGERSGQGFSLTYKIAPCDRNYSAPSGRILSPGWPNFYPHSYRCKFIIQAPAGNSITIFFTSFRIESSSTCQFDYLRVRNGSASAPIIEDLCGHTTPDPIHVPGNTLWMMFYTDSSVTYQGFDITYITSVGVCGGNLTQVSGTFASPGYPGGYNTTQTCEWLIRVPARRRPTLSFTAFDISSSSGDCDSNYVAVYNGDSDSSPLFGSFCGPVTLTQYTAMGTTLFVKYSSDTDLIGTGFLASYTS